MLFQLNKTKHFGYGKQIIFMFNLCHIFWLIVKLTKLKTKMMLQSKKII